MTFLSLGLNNGMVRVAQMQGYKDPFVIQEEVIPHVLARRDVVAIAATGSGKTAAFLIPLLQLIGDKKSVDRSSVRVLILVPTRELAQQIADVINKMSQYLSYNLRSEVVYGGVSVNPQLKELRGGIDVLVATPGRLLDIVSKNGVRLSSVEVLVLDEADRILDLGFSAELAQVFSLLPDQRQTLLFTATMSKEVSLLAKEKLNEPVLIGCNKLEEQAPAIDQIYYSVAQDAKGPFLRALLKDNEWSQILVFVSSKRRADNVAAKLNGAGIVTAVLHGDKSQGARTRVLSEFKAGAVRVLVATDLAARGLDIVALPCVINYELPRSPADYIHRIGRTGRAGSTGLAISFVSDEEKNHFRLIEKRMGQKVKLGTIPLQSSNQ